MSHRTRGALAAVGVLLAILLLAAEAFARGGRGGRGGGGLSRGGGGFSRGGGLGPGSLGAARPSPNVWRNGPARGGTFGDPGVATRPRGGIMSGPGGALGSGPGGSNPRPTSWPATPGEGLPGSTDREDRQERRGERRDERQEGRGELRQEYVEYVDDNIYTYEEYYEDGHYRVGVSFTAVHFHNLPCTTSTVVVEGVTYYRCDTTWYTRAYRGGDMTYTVVNAPPGH